MSWLKKLINNDGAKNGPTEAHVPVAHKHSDEMLESAVHTLTDFASAHYGKRTPWGVEIEELYALSHKGWQNEIPTHGAVLDIRQAPEILVQVTINGPQDYMVRVLAEKKLPNDPVSGFSPVASKIIPAQQSVLRTTLEEFIRQRFIPKQ
jgi:hypothetical protein